jgi:aryl-phospho-beta-D-glucosidase BglC (GH1 family)
MFNYNKRGEKTGKLHSSRANGCRVVLAIPFLLFGLIAGLMPASGVFGGGYRAEALSGGWSTSGTNIVNSSGGNFTISGINWYGFETKGFVAHGLYAQNYTTIVNSIKQYGFNTIRIPFSNEMWEKDPVPAANTISACNLCKGKRARDIMALIINYAGSIGLHVILDNHRSEAGNSAEANGLWYVVSGKSNFPESSWINDWLSAQAWTHGNLQSLDTIPVNYLASDGFPTVLGFDLRNEPHTPSRTPYLQGATWGTGDGVDPQADPNPNPFRPCASTSTCHDWRLAAERAGDSLFGVANANGWTYPLLFVEGIGQYPTSTGTAQSGPYDYYWWGGTLPGVNGNANNPGAPVVLNTGGNASSLGAPVYNQLVYSAHDFGPTEFQQGWFNSSTCYKSGCSSSSLADIWHKFWLFTNLPNGIMPVWPGHPAYPWANTGHTAYTQTPVYIGEAGTGNTHDDLYTIGSGSQGQWFTDIVNLIQSSYAPTTGNDSGYAGSNIHWTYWALNAEDSFALLGSGYTGLANQTKEYTFLCSIERDPFAIPPGSGANQCGSTGTLPLPS